jgi:two-component system response regulator YesN
MYKVLIVEDEINIRMGLKKLVQELVEGFYVEAEASNGKEALQQLAGWLPDLMVTDIRMPDTNGLELIKRAREQYPQLPILIISGYGDFEYAKQALHYGVEEYLLKPVDRVELAQFLEKLKHKFELAQPPTTDRLPAATATGDSAKSQRQVIRKIKELIQERLSEEITLQYIADQVHLNLKYLSQLFKAETGKNFSDYVTEARMSQAKRLLKQTHLKIYEVAAMCGYPNTKHFAVAFKQVVGLSPSDYRDQLPQ